MESGLGVSPVLWCFYGLSYGLSVHLGNHLRCHKWGWRKLAWEQVLSWGGVGVGFALKLKATKRLKRFMGLLEEVERFIGCVWKADHKQGGTVSNE